ncbi:MAG: sulfatase-like hydrolase/transferase [Polyangiaceae bacterium]|nr:sulfatase-like hydrolase/transferase [Polyangiaceae bacterium]
MTPADPDRSPSGDWGSTPSRGQGVSAARTGESLSVEPVARKSRLRIALKAGARAGSVAAVMGLVVSIFEQAVVQIWAAGRIHPSITERIGGAALGASFFGMAAWIAGSLGFLVAFGRGVERATKVKVVCATAAISIVALFHAFALALRLMLGSSLTVSGVQFFLNSAGHMMSAISSQYIGYVLMLLAGAIVLSGLVAMTVRRVSRAPITVRRVEVYSSFGMTTLAVVAIAAPLPSSITRGAAKTSPEVALIASVGASRRSERFTGETFGVLTGAALDSPKITARAEWSANATEIERRPNVIIVTLETVGANHVGFLGYKRDATPNLDRIAADSLVFERAYSTATHSNYAQMSVISSLFPRRGSALDMYQRLDYPRVLLHDLMSPLGYQTATVSSQDESWQGMQRFQTTATPTYFRHAPDHEGERLDMVTEEIAPDEETIKHAIQWIDRAAGGGSEAREPFSLYVNLQSTHFPYPIPSEAPHPYEPYTPKGTFNYVVWERDDLPTIINRYDNALRYVDAQVGRLYDALAERDLLHDTILIVTADHGENFFDHDMVTHGRSLFEEEARVPFIVHYPAWLDARHVEEPVSTLDVLPTIVDLLGLDPHPGLQGESVAWLGLPGAERSAAVFMNIQGWKHYDGIVCMPYKLVFDPDTDESALYDLVADPHENNDIAKRRPEVVVALETVLLAQIDAQERYHADDEEGRLFRGDRFAPLMLPCPEPAELDPP